MKEGFFLAFPMRPSRKTEKEIPHGQKGGNIGHAHNTKHESMK
jgi:hypothetical protein